MAKSSLFGDSVDPLLEQVFGGNTDEEDAKAKAAIDQAAAQFTNLAPPSLAPVQYQNYDWLGDYQPTSTVSAPSISYSNVNPYLTSAVSEGPSAMNGIATDPRLQDAQLGSLDALDEIANGGGLSASDKARLNQVENEVSAADRGRREAILSNMESRGMGGSGLELLAQLKSAQDATTQANQSGLDIAGDAQDRALQAIIQRGNLAGSIQGQNFGQQAQIAAANDAIDRFNAQNSTNANSTNAGILNNAAQFNATNNLGTQQYNADKAYDASKTNADINNSASLYNSQGRQTTANANTDLANKATTYNSSTLPETQFQNQVDLAKGKAGAYGQEADYYNQMGNREIGKAAANEQLAGELGAAAITKSDKRVKKDIQPLSDNDIHDFLTAIQPKKFRYKDPEAPGQSPGDRLGFLLQDVQGTKAGDAITRKDADGHLYYDRDNMDGLILAALSSLAKGNKAA